METILVVDDEDDIRTVVRKMLEAKGYTVLDTGDPQQALPAATSRGDKESHDREPSQDILTGAGIATEPVQ